MSDIPLPPTSEEQIVTNSNDIPRPKTPGLSFLRVISFIALFLSVTSFIYFISAVADFTFPSYSFDFYNPYDSVKESLPVFIASFLTLVFSLAFMRYRRVKSHDTVYSLGWRRVLYTMFSLLGLWILIGLTYIIYSWLEGDFVLRSLAKAVGSLTVIAIVALYYIAELKGVWVENTSKHIKYLAGVSVAVLIVVCTSFIFIGSPSFHRNIAGDLERRSIIETIKYHLECSCTDGILPEDNKEFKKMLEENYIGGSYTKDPSNKPLTYKKIDETTYEICANFNFDSKTVNDYVGKYDKNYSSNIDWQYEKGGCQKLVLEVNESDGYDMDYYDDSYYPTEDFEGEALDIDTPTSPIIKNK